MSEAPLSPEISDINAYDLTLDRYWAAKVVFMADLPHTITPGFYGDTPSEAVHSFSAGPIKLNRTNFQIRPEGGGDLLQTKAITLIGKSELSIFLGKAVELFQATEDAHEGFEPELHGELVWDRTDLVARKANNEQLRYYNAIAELHAIHAGLLALSDCSPENITGAP